jgi:hypothetical protein
LSATHARANAVISPLLIAILALCSPPHSTVGIYGCCLGDVEARQDCGDRHGSPASTTEQTEPCASAPCR